MSETIDRRDDRTRSRSALIKLVELLIGIPVALAFFLFLLFLLHAIFPDATGIGELARRREEPVRVRSQLGFGEPTDDRPLAVLSDVYRNVESKPASSVTWLAAQAGTRLEDRHAVKSAGGSSATITFDSSNRLSLSEKSLVVVRKPRTRFGSRRRQASVLIVDGSLHAKLGGAPREDPVEVELVTAGGAVRPADPDRPTELQLAAEREGPATLSVLQGDAEVQWQDRTVVVPSDHALRLEASRPPGKPVRLPRPPTPVTPAEGEVFTYRASTVPVSFGWKVQDGTKEFGLVIAMDPEFKEVVLDVHLQSPEFVHGHLETGRYYWRTYGLRGGARGPASPTRSFEVVLDRTGPSLTVRFPEKPLDRPRFALRGTTEPGSRVFVGETPVTTDGQGRFEYELHLQEGYNFVVVQAVDPAGNTTFRTREITVGSTETKRSS